MDMSESSIDDLNERQAALLAPVRGRGYATVEWLAEHFAVSAQTVRRDIIAFLSAISISSRPVAFKPNRY